VKSLHIELLSLVVAALLLPACEAKSVPPWPYTVASDDAAAPEGDALDDGAADDGGSGAAGAIWNNYTMPPLRCDGGLCDTDNYSLCNVAGNAAASRAAWPLSIFAAVVGVAIARRRRRREASRS
jgi:hypothetical protein